MTEQWAALDGVWHSSVGVKSSALHLLREKNLSACRQHFLIDFDTYTRAEAIAQGRACKACLKIAKRDGDILGDKK